MHLEAGLGNLAIDPGLLRELFRSGADARRQRQAHVEFGDLYLDSKVGEALEVGDKAAAIDALLFEMALEADAVNRDALFAAVT